MSSGIPIPNIISSYGELDRRFTIFFFKPELIGSRFRVQGSRFKVRGMVSAFPALGGIQVSGKDVATETRNLNHLNP